MITYKELNLNPKNKRTCDCVIRAITLATGKPYVEVYTDLFNLSLKTGYMINDKKTYIKYMEKLGFVKMKQPRHSDNTKYLIKDLDKVIGNKTAIVSCAHHLTTIKGGECVDIWDCRYKTAGNYFIKEGDE